MTAAAAACTGLTVYLWSTPKKNHIPGPAGFPLVGALYEMLPYAREGRSVYWSICVFALTW